MAQEPDGTDVERIAAWLQEQGFWLEHHTQSVLQRNGAQATLGRVYRDPQSGKLRDIDVLSDPLLTFAPINLRGVFECKAGKSGAWVIRQADIRKSEVGARAIASPRAREFIDAHPTIMRGAFPVSQPVGFSVMVVGKEKVAWDALQQAVSAAEGALSLTTGSTFVHPVLVIAAPLYGLSYDDQDEQKLTALPWWRVVHSGGEHPVLVDVVQHESLRDYLVNLRSGFESMIDALSDSDWSPDQ